MKNTKSCKYYGRTGKIIILPTEKGTVILNFEEKHKIEKLLQDFAYVPVTSNPIRYLEKTTLIKIEWNPMKEETK